MSILLGGVENIFSLRLKQELILLLLLHSFSPLFHGVSLALEGVPWMCGYFSPLVVEHWTILQQQSLV